MSRKLMVSWMIIFGVIITVYAGILNRIQKAYIDRDFEKTEKLILKSIQKDTINPGAKYYYSVLFLDTAFQRYHIDSSSLFIEAALNDFHIADAKIHEDLQDIGLSMDELIRQRNEVAKSAFFRADTTNTVAAWDDFRDRYSYSELMSQATYLRDSLAYELVLVIHTWEAYQGYFEQYPNSSFVPQAKENYHILLFKDYTKDDKTESYITFLKEHPKTPFRKQAEEVIFERTTVLNLKKEYIQFIRDYPKSHLVKKAADIAYYLGADPAQIDQQVYRLHPKIDSLKDLHQLNQEVLFTLFSEAKFGFLNSSGEVILDPKYQSVNADYLCGDITDSWLEVKLEDKNILISRTGDSLLSEVEDYQTISPAVRLVRQDEQYLYHASGFKIIDQTVDDASILKNGWINFKHDYDWGICTPTGKVLLDARYDAIEMVGPYIVVEKDDQMAITTVQHLSLGDADLDFQFDDYELIQDTLMQVFYEDQEGVIDTKLNFIVPLEEQEVYISGSFWYIKTPDVYQMVKEEEAEIIDQEFSNIAVNDGWLALKKENWILLSRYPGGVRPMNDIDSVKMLNEFATLIKKGDTLDLLFQNRERVPLVESNELSVFIWPGSDASYLDVKDGFEHKVIDRDANLIFWGDFDELTLMADSLFKYKYRGKTGVRRTDGSNVVAAEYDVVDKENQLLFLLKDGRIGCYDLRNGALIPAEYSARIKRIRENYEVVKNGKHGLVNAVNKKVVGFNYDEMIDWNDTSLWVRDGLDWSLINLDEEVIEQEIHSVKLWIKVGDEQLAIISGEDGYGLYGNVRGEILPIEYNEIINVGSLSNPVFMAEQHLKAAELYVVTYFNAQGETIKSIPYRSQEYDLIYCDQ
ncbi:WG repeat-containing protein [Marinoscillum pacificum]|uniref:WG repeat-containing protein n=1 Tax=Marinoscillum pacificum TaxID=392723 RepID=UPI002157E67E|nr:WG repeat-containing protein [Marinoscillum pacificum]